MIKYFCDRCGNQCDKRYIDLKTMQFLRHIPETDDIYAESDSNKDKANIKLCPDCFNSFKNFLEFKTVTLNDPIKLT